MRIPGDTFGLKNFFEMEKEIKYFLGKKLQSHKSSFDQNNIRDYIDCFILEANRRNHEEPASQHYFQGNRAHILCVNFQYEKYLIIWYIVWKEQMYVRVISNMILRIITVNVLSLLTKTDVQLERSLYDLFIAGLNYYIFFL